MKLTNHPLNDIYFFVMTYISYPMNEDELTTKIIGGILAIVAIIFLAMLWYTTNQIAGNVEVFMQKQGMPSRKDIAREREKQQLQARLAQLDS